MVEVEVAEAKITEKKHLKEIGLKRNRSKNRESEKGVLEKVQHNCVEEEKEN